MVRDPLSDFLIRIKNAQSAGMESAHIPYSSFLWEVAKILEREGYLTKVERRGKRTRRMIEAGLVYDQEKQGRITEIKRVSKQSRRVYARAQDLYQIKRGFGMKLISTSSGIMTSKEARKSNIGGEVLFEIW